MKQEMKYLIINGQQVVAQILLYLKLPQVVREIKMIEKSQQVVDYLIYTTSCGKTPFFASVNISPQVVD